ncbi:porin [Vibrio nereis]|uniref:Porin n=1 Tax=Vibrio nereis TaxID=693 RepID=A0A0M0HTI0_VIBNE|nr:porin [Vibrio nereis]KOO05380.1 porin [Vibrio nereis]
MKKTLVALSVLAAASASASNLYQNEDTSVKVSGEVDAIVTQLEYKNGGTKVVDNDPQIKAWANVQFDIDHKVSDTVTAFGSFEVEADNGDTVKVDDAKVGFKGDFGKVSFGETGSSYSVLEKGQLTNEGADIDTINDGTESAGHGVRYEITVAESLALSADLQTQSDKDTDNDWAVSADYSIADFTIGAAYLQADEKGVNFDRNAYGVSAAYDADGVYVAATFTEYQGQGAVDIRGGDDYAQLPQHDGNTMSLAGAYSWDAYKVYAAYQVLSADETTGGANVDADLTNWYIGTEYQVMGNLTAFVEYNAAELDSSDLGDKDADFVAAGLYLTF